MGTREKAAADATAGGAFRLPAALAAIVAACACALAVWWGALNQDEGWYLYAARLVGDGLLPYRDFFFTQGPVLPFVYSALPIGGILSGRIATACISLAATLMAMAFARRLVPPGRRGAAGLAVFATLACSLYHVYFTAIPKTYALGALFVMAGFLLLSKGMNFLSALSFAVASGTRISLVLILGVVGVWLLASRPRRPGWLAFGLGGAVGLFVVYGAFALDGRSLDGLLAAQAYHAGRGGFDAFFAAGSVSRLARGYLALGAVAFAAILCGRRGGEGAAPDGARGLRRVALCSFAAVFLLQLSAPFPYDDYAVPIMPLLAAVVSAAFAERAEGAALRWFPVLVAGMCAFASPLLQDWTTNGHDRFWPLRKGRSELSQLRDVARRLEALDPGGREILTQDTYLAVEMGRRVPSGMEMGPFSYFPRISAEEARKAHVLNGELMESAIESSECRLAAVSGYGFAIESPMGSRTPEEVRMRYLEALGRRYGLVGEERGFGQNHTTLQVFERRLPSGAAGRR